MSWGSETLYSHMSKAPTPATKTAYLPSKGYDEMRATKHRFVKTVETSFEIPTEDGTPAWEDVWVFMFACEETGVERIWGYQSRDFTEIPLRDN